MFGALEKKMDDRFDALKKKMEAGSDREDYHFANLAHKINILDEHLGTVEVKVNQIDQRLEAGGQAALHDGETRMRMRWALSQTRKVDPTARWRPPRSVILGRRPPSAVGRFGGQTLRPRRRFHPYASNLPGTAATFKKDLYT